MSVLYQALKKQDQLERAGTTASTARIYHIPRKRDFTPIFTGVLATFLFCSAAFFGVPYFTKSDTIETKNSAIAILPPPVTTEVAKKTPATSGDESLNIVDINDASQIVAFMPGGARDPLPTDGPIQVNDNRDYDVSSGPEIGKWSALVSSNPEAAIAPLKNIVRTEPGNALAHAQLALAYARLRVTADAESAFKTALSLKPQDGQIWYNYAVMLDQSNNKPAAIDAYTNALINVGRNSSYDVAAVQARLEYLKAL